MSALPNLPRRPFPFVPGEVRHGTAPTLRQVVERAVQADDEFARHCSSIPACCEPTADEEVEFMELEEAQAATREALYAALAELGIDRELANKIGRVLV